MRRRRVGRPGLVGTMARTAVVAGTASAVAGGVSNRRNNKANAAAQDQAQQQHSQAEMDAMQAQLNDLQAQQAPPPPPPAAAPAKGDLIAELSKLGDLKAAGLLSDDEFAAAKAKLLA